MVKAERISLIVALILVSLYFLISYIFPAPITSLPEIPVVREPYVSPTKLSREIVLVPTIVRKSKHRGHTVDTGKVKKLAQSVSSDSSDKTPYLVSEIDSFSPVDSTYPIIILDTTHINSDTVKYSGSMVTKDFKMDYEIAVQYGKVLYMTPRFTLLRELRPKNFSIAPLAGATVIDNTAYFSYGAYGSYKGYSAAYIQNGPTGRTVLIGVNFKF